MKFLVTASEAEPQLVEESELRNTVHALFCCCSDAANCDNENLAEFDEHDAEEIRSEGFQLDFEDGWIDVEPEKLAKRLSMGDGEGQICAR